jgi:hypothetical protein
MEASWDFLVGASKIAPHSVSLLAERDVLPLEVFDYHGDYYFTRRDAEDAENRTQSSSR